MSGVRPRLVRAWDCPVERGGCGATRGNACRTKGGPNPGTITQPHAPRWQQQRDADAAEYAARQQPAGPAPDRAEYERLRWIEKLARDCIRSWREQAESMRASSPCAVWLDSCAEELAEILTAAGPRPDDDWLEAALAQVEAAGLLLAQIRGVMS